MDNPAVDVQLIERIVREVLAGLGSQLGSPDAASPDAPSAPPAQPLPRAEIARPQPARDGELTLANKVITLGSVESRLDGIRRLVVAPHAILTPAVQDLLVEKGITVSRGPVIASAVVGAEQASRPANVPTGFLPVTVILVTQKLRPEQLDRLLRPDGISAQYEVLGCLIRASERAAEVCQGGGLGVLITRHVAAEVCLANRRPGVRAVPGYLGIDIVQQTAAVGANVLVADLTAGVFHIKRMTMQFVRASHECPAALREYLEQR